MHLGTYQIALDTASRHEGNMRKSQLRDAPKLQGMEEHYHYFQWGDATQTQCFLFYQYLVYNVQWKLDLADTSLTENLGLKDTF